VKKVGKNYRLVAIGSTTSRRMDKYMPMLNKLGVKAVIGKGGMKNVGSVLYLSYAGGCAALGAKMLKIKKVEWLDLGIPEAVWHLKATNFGPLVVSIKGKRSLYKSF
jgi:fumarate hydratase subunit beta